jgi:DNA-binding winged helix-turn-helix (wHTH) protein/predicted ATPase
VGFLRDFCGSVWGAREAGVYMIRFGPYQLDRAQGLRRGKQEVRVTPKSLSVLWVLAERAGQVVSKEEVFRVVWPDTAVSDSALTTCIQELRQALRDDARQPKFIETLHRRGYRFLAKTSSLPNDGSQPAVPLSVHTDGPVVGREPVLGQMLDACALAERGLRQVLFVTGEPGIGKTAVVQAFLSRVAARGGVRATWGQCVQHYGVGEPYQPLLEALMRLCRRPGGDRLVRELERYSPTWLAQLPALLTPERRASLQRTVVGTTQERMLRELTDAFEVMTAQLPLVLWLEDLHWSDMSTLDWVAAFAQRPEPARLLLIGTFWPPAIIGTEHPLAALSDRLRIKRFCREIALGGIDEAGVVEYVAFRFPPAPGHTEALGRLARLVCRHTGGNPLFIINVLSDLVARGLLVQQDGLWTASSDVNVLILGIPDDVHRTIERQVDRLPPGERGLLEIASVVGGTFSAATVACAAGLALNEVETTLAALARQHRLVQEAGVLEWPDGTIAARFAFLHVLYRDVLYERVPAGYRAELHRQIGAREEAAYGEQASEIAAELAMHFERSGDRRRAGIYLQQAAENARRSGAFTEAQMHFQRALALLESQIPSRERTEREVMLRIGLGGALMATRGWGAPEAEETYSRARALCHELGDTPRLFPALWGLWLFYWGRGPMSTAHELAHDLLGLAHRHGDDALLLQAHHAAWATAFSRGDLEATCFHAEEGIRLYRPDRHAAMAATYGSHDPGVCGRGFLARALALLGRMDEASRTSDEGVAQARDLGHPFSLVISHVLAAAVAQICRHPTNVRKHAVAAATIAREQDFRLMLAWSSAFEGWAAVVEGRHGPGLDRIGNGVAEARAMGSNQFQPQLVGFLAEAHLRNRHAATGLEALDEAFAIARRMGERFWEPELYRLRGELHLLANSPSAIQNAERDFLEAIEVAQSQGAKLLVLRAAVGLGRLWQQLGRGAQARQLVTERRGDITEGLGLPDMVEATAFLSE